MVIDNDDVDLAHHGDVDATDGLVDLAVNVAATGTPDWLMRVITDSLADLHRYPDARDAITALAAAHHVDSACVLPTSGAAEAFTLLARAQPWRRPVVVHPQFTEPEAALRAAGHRPDRVLLSGAHGFVLDPVSVDPDADLIMIGNPTNPTSVLHPRAAISSLVRPGRIVAVDEAFMDAVPGEPESMIDRDLDGVLVIRSLTKTWALPGLRAGYVVGDPELITRLRRQQPPWSVSGPALSATVAAVSARARAAGQRYADQLAEQRAVLADRLAGLGLPVAGVPRAPFVLIDTGGWLADPRPDAVRLMLAEHGFAVRRGETFPGLGPAWIRMAVRDEQTSADVCTALATIKKRDGG